MINIDKILKVMRADLPANFDKAILASELVKAKNWYRTRCRLDKWPKREKIVGRFIKDTERYRARLETYSKACQDIPLPPRLPPWLNSKALGRVLTKAKAGMGPLHENEAAQKILVEFGVDRGSPMDFLLGSMLPKIYRKVFKLSISVRDSIRTPETPFVRFAVEAARQIVGKKPSPETVASSYRTMNVPGAGRRRASKATVQN